MTRNTILPAPVLAVGAVVTLPVVAAGNHDWDAVVGETHVHTNHGD